MKTFSIVRSCALILLAGSLMEVRAGEVAIYTGTTQWIAKNLADQQAQICADKLTAAGVDNVWYPNGADGLFLAEWMETMTGNGQVDVCVLYGDPPNDIYPVGNTMPDGSIAEMFIESEDGDAIINHADYMFWGLNASNQAGGLQNMMDNSVIVMWDDNTPMTVTGDGRDIAPSLTDFLTDRPFHLDQLAGEWFPEMILAQNATGTRADPVIVRDGPRGRLIPVFQTADQNDPKGAVAAEIIFWLLDIDLQPTKLGLAGPLAAIAGKTSKLKIDMQDVTGSPRPTATDLTVNLASDSATGKFDTQRKGPFDGTVTSVTIPAGGRSASFYYKDSAAGTVKLTASANGFSSATFDLKVLEEFPADPGEVLIYTGVTQWISKAAADQQAQICLDKLAVAGIPRTWVASELEVDLVAAWLQFATGNGSMDVLVLYGDLPPAIYPQGNTMPDGSLVEQFVESTDGDAVINHADYMFWGLNGRNQVGGLQNIMDIPGIVMWDDNTPVKVTEEGKEIAPSLTDYLTDRPFHLDELAGEWFPEVILAENAAGTRADPVIVRDGNRGRLIPVYQTNTQNDPKGAVAAEIILWMHGKSFTSPVQLGLRGQAAILAGRALAVTVELQDATGSPRAAGADVTVNLQSNKPTGAFDTRTDGPFDGTVRSVTIPTGTTSLTFFYRDPAEGVAVLSAGAAGLTGGNLQVNVFTVEPAERGQVAIYTGTTQWIAKPLADEQAQICVNALTAEGIEVLWYPLDTEMTDFAAWMEAATANGAMDVAVLYGDLPPTLYPDGNVMPDGSIVEQFIESEDGDAVINHADYMFWGLNARNSEGGLRNIMDIPDIVMWDDNTPMVVTPEGSRIAPSLTDFMTDRPFHLDQLAGDWWPEVVLAQNAAGTRADPVIVRDGPRGRLIPCFQTADGVEPKGQVAAEIITWLMAQQSQPLLPPTGLMAVAGDRKVDLTWTAPPGGGVLVGYNVYQTNPGGRTKVTPAPVTGTQYTVMDLPNDIEHCFVVTAVDTVLGESRDSNQACATPKSAAPVFKRGDVDGNGSIEITDPISLLGFLFLGEARPPCHDAADTDDNGALEITDAIASLGFQFLGDAPPPDPGPTNCGPDLTEDQPDQDFGCDYPPASCAVEG